MFWFDLEQATLGSWMQEDSGDSDVDISKATTGSKMLSHDFALVALAGARGDQFC